ncbi:Inositol-1-monophosphatase [Planctomycetes bacterium Poly30]|uniref:Inositol-1-monophosphatase n=1 Tax=Saltatorellus ferox TaxID=2528018 RepID=A0A518ETH7_9BACT|nr:Inositol-1-monophosphatase [Planctomycetes bacterium Poly30]
MNLARGEALVASALDALGLEERPHATVPTAAVRAALFAAIRAGDLQLSSLGRLRGSEVRTKSSMRDLVTDVDLGSERLIVEALRAATPDFTVEAEEEAADAKSEAPRWIVDPLDGTVNYVHGIPMFAVSIGLHLLGPDGGSNTTRPLFGVVHAPRLGETFVAVEGRGSFCLTSQAGAPDGPVDVARLRVSRPDGLADAILATGFPYRRNELEHSNLENFNAFFYDVRGVRRLGAAALDLAYVAAGRLDGFWELHLGPHDMAAGALLVREAGGEVTDCGGGDTWLRSGHLVAGHAPLAAAIRERVRF